jgi:hypothetical protein
MIKLLSIDRTIWNLEQRALDIVTAIHRNEPVVLDLNGEGPDLEHIGLYRLLDRICSEYNYPKSRIIIVTANFLEQHPEYTIRHQHQQYELAGTQNLVGQVDTTKQFDRDFRHFGHFIGHSNRYRLELASHLYTHHRQQTLQTYHSDPAVPYHREHLGLEDYLAAGATHDEFNQCIDLLSASPLTLDIAGCTETISVPENLGIVGYYPKFFVELVNMSYYSGRTFYVDEKIWRPVLMRTPFMAQSSQGFVANLQRLGFRTFDNYWDEGYSQDPVNCQVPAMRANIDRISQLSVLQLQSMYADMQPILEHNYNRLLELRPTDFKQELFHG